MAYDQYGNRMQNQRPYYNQPAQRGPPRGPPPPRGPDPYAYQQTNNGQERFQQDSRGQGYTGYDDGDILDQYGDEEPQGYAQGNGAYNSQNGYAGGYNQQQRQPMPQQYRDPPPRRDQFGPPQRSMTMPQNMEPGYRPAPNGNPAMRNRGPPDPNYAPRNRPPPQGGAGPYNDRPPHQYDDRQQYQGPRGAPPAGQRPRERLIQPTSPKNMPFDNPFPMFPEQGQQYPAGVDSAERSMANMNINGRPSLEGKRPPTSGSQHSQHSARSNQNWQDLGRGPPNQNSNDNYGQEPSFGSPQRAMTMPQNMDSEPQSRQFQHNPNYDIGQGGYGRPTPDPIPQRSFTAVGERHGPMQAPQRPSTAAGNRPNGPYGGPQGNYGADDFRRPPPQNFMGPRPGTSQGYREGPRPMQSQPMNKEAQLEAYMPDFDGQSSQRQPMQDAIGLPLDAAPEAGMISQKPNMPPDMHKARSQPNLRGQANGYPQDGYQEPVPRMPPLDPGAYGGQRRSPPRALVTDPNYMQRQQVPRPGYVPSPDPLSPRQFHRPGAPPINRVGTAESGYSDPGPNGVRGPPGAGPMLGQPMRPPNPDALPAHPAPVRPGHNNARPGAANIRQEQAKRMSDASSHQPRPLSGPITIQELYRVREAAKAQPQDRAKQVYLAKKLVQASMILADENGAADAKTTQRNRENYVNEAYKLIKKQVAANSPEAMFYLADCHGTGDLGVSVDPKEAFMLYQSAAKLGHGPSAYRTAVCCEMGQANGGGTREDPLKAVQWYRRAAALGDIPAMYKLGMILLKGHLGQPPNLGEALIWLQRAANAADPENPHALHELAALHESAPPGGKIIRDEKYALELYTKAAKFGYRNSQNRLGQAFEYGQLGCPIDNRNSIHWYSKAAAQEDHDAELALSGWYLTGCVGILEQNDQEAYLWARKAAVADHPKAEFAMGYFSETGIGCPKSFEDAKRWYGRAAGHRYPKARERLEELTRSGHKGMKNKERISRSDNRKHEDCIVM